ncbi:hypothetical protein [Brevibacillus fulvus]|uniref:Uncharacterized protein n=1 Tax=Brevibacillus fulvus TaxID=1125967 RepID=A0A938XYW7_9BACL|nr:hypothetical protein [Brevibacillus fulvus]MBM7589439.1 hypothetical protein [Brevibacillus fulvus]
MKKLNAMFAIALVASLGFVNSAAAKTDDDDANTYKAEPVFAIWQNPVFQAQQPAPAAPADTTSFQFVPESPDND